MIRTAKYIKRVGTFMSNGVGEYVLNYPCTCGNNRVLVDDYATGEVKCHICKSVLFENFDPIFE